MTSLIPKYKIEIEKKMEADSRLKTIKEFLHTDFETLPSYYKTLFGDLYQGEQEFHEQVNPDNLYYDQVQRVTFVEEANRRKLLSRVERIERKRLFE